MKLNLKFTPRCTLSFKKIKMIGLIVSDYTSDEDFHFSIYIIIYNITIPCIKSLSNSSLVIMCCTEKVICYKFTILLNNKIICFNF